jgi:MoaA/NifB/PqqE/SkfB family radical SAM enzyme
MGEGGAMSLAESLVVPDFLQTDIPDRTAHLVRNMPVVVIALHEGCGCRCLMCDIWKVREPRSIPLATLERQLESLERLQVRWVVLSGGEPQRHPHFYEFVAALRSRKIRVTVLTAGLELETDAAQIAASVDDLIVSLDGPPAIHNQIRRIPLAYERLLAAVRAVRRLRPRMPICARCTVQKVNHAFLCETVECAQSTGLDSISFLAADLTSPAFNRPSPWQASRQNSIALCRAELDTLDGEIEQLIQRYVGKGFVVESVAKLRRIALHFRAHLGIVPPIAPRCNAPWVSAVIEASGQVRPCFFHVAVGNIHQQSFAEIVNGETALRFRAALDIAANPTCRRCVCSLHISQPGT